MKDTKIEKLIRAEERRQRETIDLIASENFVSKDVSVALGSVFTNKYAEGYPGRRYYAGVLNADALELETQRRALELFGLSPKKWSVNIQPLSGSPANLAIYLALVPKGGRMMGMRLDAGGHLTHGFAGSISGKFWDWKHYVLNSKTELLDYTEIMRTAKKWQPKLIVAGGSAYSRVIDWDVFRRIANGVGAILMIDLSHYAGLVAGRAYPSPFPYADVVMTTTHKTLRGPRGAMIFVKNEYAKAINRAIFPGVQGGPHLNQIAALGIALHEAGTPEFKKYAKQVVKNAHMLAKEIQKRGWRIVSGGTDSHLFTVDVGARGVRGNDAEKLLERAGMIVNREEIPNDTGGSRDPSGIRIGTPAVTTRGMKEKEMKTIAAWFDSILTKRNDAGIQKAAKNLCKRFILKN
ncbi:MAG: serine hydroxymethyltransferase [Patescibacteria group bacterium]